MRAHGELRRALMMSTRLSARPTLIRPTGGLNPCRSLLAIRANSSIPPKRPFEDGEKKTTPIEEGSSSQKTYGGKLGVPNLSIKRQLKCDRREIIESLEDANEMVPYTHSTRRAGTACGTVQETDESRSMGCRVPGRGRSRCRQEKGRWAMAGGYS